MSDREQAEELLEIAERDLRALRGMLDAPVFADEVFGFLAQQAIEESLKAWLCVLGRTYPLTHDLTHLLSLLDDAGEDVLDLWDVAGFNPFAVGLRYSSLSANDKPLDRGGAIARVEAVLKRAGDAIS